MIRDNINNALKEAVKSQSKIRVGTLRLVQATLKDRDIAARTQGNLEGVSDEAVLEILAKMVRQREESAQTYQQAGREELAAQEREEIEIIKEFMPAQMSEAEIKKRVDDVLAELGATHIKDMGRIMRELKASYAGQMDFSLASGYIKEKLG